MHLGSPNGRGAEGHEQLAADLRARGLRVTSQRLLIARALRGLDRHATADEVLEAARAELPGVSLPTIYATLDLLAELGVVRRVSSGVGPALYDPRLDGHHHLACRRCARVADVPGALDAASSLASAERAGWQAVAAELVVTGLCPACAAVARG